MGCVLGQHDETRRKEHVIYYLSNKFNDYESRYSMLEKTCYVLAWLTKRLRKYMLTHTTLLISKMDPVKYIFEKYALTDRVASWQMALTKYDIQYVTQKEVKWSVLYDYLDHQPLEDYHSICFESLYKDIMLIRDCNIPIPKEGPELGSRWTLAFNGASNAHGNGIGAVITSPTGFYLPFTVRLCFECTNNMEEYEACIFGIEAVIVLRIKILEVCGNASLVISLIKGDWEARDHKLIFYKEHVLKLILYFDEITFHHIPREENRLANALATFSSMFKVKWKNEAPTFHLDYLDEPTYYLAAEDEDHGHPWF
ncbi:uncharacterized protein LOC127135722 [Lathyrus oleraceus]|uniref:uncharacterized protein LOC127135722 n=1 Tax=Pisum sativum TaxID=3888 RepID=UPI0021CE1974|nr:uncharacterized protein LOC127135722 [Pisum sativum]